MSETTVREVDGRLPEVRTEDEPIAPSRGLEYPLAGRDGREPVLSDELCRVSIRTELSEVSDALRDALYICGALIGALRLIGKRAPWRAQRRAPGSLGRRRADRLDVALLAVNSERAGPCRQKFNNVAALAVW